MSSQKGNSKRTRPQKYKNHTAFKNNLHDTSQKTKLINNIDVANVCERCKKIIEWKIKYKKYKPLKAPGKCVKCEQKTIRHAYHTMCLTCAKKFEVCAKCGNKGEIVESKPSKEETLKLDAELQALLKSLSERKRRTFLRYMNKNAEKKNKSRKEKNTEKRDDDGDVEEEEEDDEVAEAEENNITRDDLLSKLKSLAVKDEDEFDEDDFGSDLDDDFT